MLKRSSRVRASRSACSCQLLAARRSSSTVATKPNWARRKHLPREVAKLLVQAQILAGSGPSVRQPLLAEVQECEGPSERALARGDRRAHRSVPWLRTERTALAPRHRTRGRASRCAPARAPAVACRQERCRAAAPASPRPPGNGADTTSTSSDRLPCGAPRAGRVRCPR